MGHGLSFVAKRQTVVFVAEANEDVGLGHVGRSTAVAAALGARGVPVHMLLRGTAEALMIDGLRWEPEIGSGHNPAAAVVVDSYDLDPTEIETILGDDSALVWMHDPRHYHPDPALVVDVPGSHGPRRLAGLQYACLRAPFWGLQENGPREEVATVVVTTGGSDPEGSLGELVLRIQDALPGAHVMAVRGPFSSTEIPDGVTVLEAPSSLLEPFLQADLIVCAGGQTMLEAAASGTPTLALVLAENQRRQASLLAAAGGARVLERPSELKAVLREMAGDHSKRRKLASRGRQAVDGYGALRVAFRIAQLLGTPPTRTNA